MNTDDAGVAGFFEDLPVLMFVLMGVATLVLSGTWVSQNLETIRIQEELDSFAEDLVDSVLSRILRHETPDLMPSMSWVQNISLSDLVSEIVGERHYLIAIVSRYPSFAWLKTESNGDPVRLHATGYCSELLNVLDGSGRTAMLEVRAIVW